jgi:hypothetical protein
LSIAGTEDSGVMGLYDKVGIGFIYFFERHSNAD